MDDTTNNTPQEEAVFSEQALEAVVATEHATTNELTGILNGVPVAREPSPVTRQSIQRGVRELLNHSARTIGVQTHEDALEQLSEDMRRDQAMINERLALAAARERERLARVQQENRNIDAEREAHETRQHERSVTEQFWSVEEFFELRAARAAQPNAPTRTTPTRTNRRHYLEPSSPGDFCGRCGAWVNRRDYRSHQDSCVSY